MRRKFTQTLSGRNTSFHHSDRSLNYLMLIKLYEVENGKKNCMPALPKTDPRNKVAINYRSTYDKPRFSLYNFIGLMPVRKYLSGVPRLWN